MAITCGDFFPSPLWHCDQPATSVIEVVWKDRRPGQGGGRIDYPYCARHEPDAERMAYMLQEHLEISPDFSDVRIETPILGEAREVESARLLTSQSFKEF